MQQITDKLYVGSMEDALANSSSTSIDIIIYLGQEIPQKLCFNCAPTCIHIPLNDGKNGLMKIRDVMFITYIIMEMNKKVLIACRAGISRSILFTAAVFALLKKISFDEAYEHITKITPRSQPEQHLFSEVKQVMEEMKCCI